MRAPSNLDSIVSNIVDELCARSTDDSPLVDDWNLRSAEIDVRATIQYLKGLDRPISYRAETKNVPFRGWRKENIEDFRALGNQIKRLETMLKAMTSPALFSIFSGEVDLKSDRSPSDQIQRTVINRLKFFKSELAWLRQRCEFLLTKRLGEHGKAEYRQHRVAHEAWHLLRRFGKVPADGSADSLYGRITSKLWEALTGEISKDLQWACKTTLQLADEGELREI
jgi:hypothetical protein